MPFTALITGATKGIGRALAETFAEHGCHLVLSARNEKALKAIQATFTEKYPEISVFIKAADLKQVTQVEELIQFVNDACPKLDVLINNAGIFYQAPLLEEPENRLSEMMDLNLFAPYYLCRAFAPQMRTNGQGHIFNICSIASQTVFPGSGSYAITKFALLGLTKALRQELLDSKVKVTAVLPGATWTASWEASGVPPERLMAAKEVAEAVWQVWKIGPSAVVEEIVLRPQLGDL